MKTENKLITATMLSFGISGACCLALGSLIPFLRENYGLSYDFAGMQAGMGIVAVMTVLLFFTILISYFANRPAKNNSV